MAFTEQQKGRVLHHLGYPNWSMLSNGIQLGFPAGAQPLFLVEQAFKLLTPDGEAEVANDICECDAIECQLTDARSRFRALEIGELKLNPHEPRQLRQELFWWRNKLSDDLGVAPNPRSMMALSGEAGGINARVLR
jgi:hypothetical protein